jgi:hypothetical protein
MRRLYAAAGVAALLAIAFHSSGRATPPVRPHYHPGPECPVCAYGPHTETVKKTTYGTKEEPFCVKRVTFASLFSCRPECGAECVARTRTRLVKCETTEEVVKLKCAVEPASRLPTWMQTPGAPIAPVRPVTPPGPVAPPAPLAPVVPMGDPIAPAAPLAPLAPQGPLAPLPPR